MSTIQYEINHLSSQLNNFCMSLKSKLDRQAGTAFFFDHYDALGVHSHLPTDEDGVLEPGLLTMLTEKLINDILAKDVFGQPIHAGVSVNDTFQELNTWIGERNADWATRLRQQVAALVVKCPGPEEEQRMDEAVQGLIETTANVLSQIYPGAMETQRKKLDAIFARATKLNLAMKGQEITVCCASIEEGAVVELDERLLQPASKGKPEGKVLLVVAPPFVAADPRDEEHGFIIHGKAYCV